MSLRPPLRRPGVDVREGDGVAPDYEVDNPPAASFRGEDAQLGADVGLLREKIAREPVPALAPQPLPGLGTPGAMSSRLGRGKRGSGYSCRSASIGSSFEARLAG